MTMRDDWESLKLAVLNMDYGKQAYEWNNMFPPVKDDRRVFINIYHQIVDGVKSLPDNPNTVVCVAMNRYIAEERKTMDEIKSRFCG